MPAIPIHVSHPGSFLSLAMENFKRLAFHNVANNLMTVIRGTAGL